LADDGNEREYRKDSLLFLSTSDREQIINKILRFSDIMSEEDCINYKKENNIK
jgi:hypothetical protein